MAAIPVIGGASALGGNHGRAQRVLGGATAAESGAILRLEFALKHQSAQAFAGLLDADLSHAKPSFSIKLGVSRAQAQTALRDFADPTPLARHHVEHFTD